MPTRRTRPNAAFITRPWPLLATVLLVWSAGCAPSGIRTEPVYFPPPPAEPRAVHLVSFNSLADVVPAKVNWVDALLGGRSASPFVRTPVGLAFQGETLYICDVTAGSILAWNLTTGRTRTLGRDGEVTLVTPVDVAADEWGSIYVADTGLSRVVAFDLATGGMRQLSPPDRDDYRPVAVAAAAGRLYVADAAAHQVDAYSLPDLELATSIGSVGSDDGNFYYPAGLAVAPDGRLVVADTFNSRVQVFDAAGNHTASFGQAGDRYGDMGKPKRVAVAPGGVVFVADSEFARVHLFDLQGRLLMLLGDDSGPAAVAMPSAVAVAPTLPESLAEAVPAGFHAEYFLFLAESVGDRRLSLYAVGSAE